MYCVLSDRLECAELIIKAGADVNRKDIGGRTALHWAAHKVPYCTLSLVVTDAVTDVVTGGGGTPKGGAPTYYLPKFS